MTAKIIDCKRISEEIKQEVRTASKAFHKKKHRNPCLAVALVGDNPASQIYVGKKRQACCDVSIDSLVYYIIKSQESLINIIKQAGEDASIDGMLVQLPLPEGYNVNEVFDALDPRKDVDVFNPINVGLLVQNRPRFIPCTPHGIQQMLRRSDISIEGNHVVIINRSNIVGKPLSSMLIQDDGEKANATVTVCHDRTPPEELKKLCRDADIIVVAVGIPNFLTADMVRENQVVIDVGITRMGKKVVGDVHPDVREVVGWISTVPGGVGLLTVSMLLHNTLKAAELLDRSR